MKNYQAYLFDLDGTLIKTVDLIYECFCHSLKEWFNIRLDRDTIISHVGLPLREQFKIFLKLANKKPDNIDYEALCAFHMQHQLKIWHNYISLFPGVKETLETLKARDKRLAIVTSRYLLSAEKYLKHVEIWDLFEVIITPELTATHKPSAEPALKALEKIGMDKEKNPAALFIGDSVYDMECAKNTEIDSYLVLWGAGKIEEIKFNPTYVAKNLSLLI